MTLFTKSRETVSRTTRVFFHINLVLKLSFMVYIPWLFRSVYIYTSLFAFLNMNLFGTLCEKQDFFVGSKEHIRLPSTFSLILKRAVLYLSSTQRLHFNHYNSNSPTRVFKVLNLVHQRKTA